MRFRVTVRKLNVTDGQTRQTDGVRFNISRPGPSAWREITKHPEMRVHIGDVMDVCLHIRHMHLGETLEIPIGVGGVRPTAVLPTPTS